MKKLIFLTLISLSAISFANGGPHATDAKLIPNGTTPQEIQREEMQESMDRMEQKERLKESPLKMENTNKTNRKIKEKGDTGFKTN